MQTLSQHGLVIKVFKDDKQGYLSSSSLLDSWVCFFSAQLANQKPYIYQSVLYQCGRLRPIAFSEEDSNYNGLMWA